MAKAYKCDLCGDFGIGGSDLQMAMAKGLGSFIGIRYNPESEQAQLYLHDLCPKCSKGFYTWWAENKKG